MTGKQAMPDSDGPGVRANKARRRKFYRFALGYAMIFSAFTIGLLKYGHHPAPGEVTLVPPQFAAIAAVLIPLMWIATLAFTLPRFDELMRRTIVDAYAGGFVTSSIAFLIWLFLSKGGLASPPSALIIFFVGVGGVAISFGWLRQRRL